MDTANTFTAINDGAAVSSGKDTLDKLGMVIEIAKAKGEPNWDELAERLGSASGASTRKVWQNLCRSHVLRRKGEVDPNAPKSAKVTKPRAPRKKATPKKKKAVEKDVVDDEDDDEEEEVETPVKGETKSEDED